MEQNQISASTNLKETGWTELLMTQSSTSCAKHGGALVLVWLCKAASETHTL